VAKRMSKGESKSETESDQPQTPRAGVMEMYKIMYIGRFNDRDWGALNKIPIPQTVTLPPAGHESEWPPDDAMKEWLNLVLDNEMHRELRIELDRRRIRAETAIARADREALRRDATNREVLAIVCATDKNESDDEFVALLRDPTHTLSMGFREELIHLRRRRPANRPSKSKDDRRGDSKMWRVYACSRAPSGSSPSRSQR
jgi:hypothetical protein